MFLFANNAIGTLAAGIGPTDTEFSLSPGQYTKFPILTGADTFYITLTDAATQENIEIMLVTGTGTNIFTVERGQNGTTAQSWIANDIVSARCVQLEYADFLSKTFGGVIAGPIQINNTLGVLLAATFSSTVTAAGFNVSSDYRLKTDVEPIEASLQTLAHLRPVSYHFRDERKRTLGVIAHELQAALPDLVTGAKDDPNNMQAVDYIQLVPLLVAAVQELQREIAWLKGE